MKSIISLLLMLILAFMGISSNWRIVEEVITTEEASTAIAEPIPTEWEWLIDEEIQLGLGDDE